MKPVKNCVEEQKKLEQKKTDRANLERYRFQMFAVALVIILSCLYTALQWDTSVSDEEQEELLKEVIDDLDFNKLKKNRDMVAAISETDEPSEVTNVRPIEQMVESKPQKEQTKLVVDEGQGEIPEANVEEVKPQTLENDNDKPEGFKTIEELPEFPGGASAFMKWITANLKYPKNASERKIEGKVVVSFIVNKEGEVKNLKIVKTPNSYLTQAVVQTMSKMPKWKPGKQNGKPCDAMVSVPINFDL